MKHRKLFRRTHHSWRAILVHSILYAFALILFAIILLFSGSLYLLNTPSGFRLLFKIAHVFMLAEGNTFKATGISGTVSNFSLDSLQIQTKKTTLQLDQLRLKWSPLWLFHHEVVITHLSANRVLLQLPNVFKSTSRKTSPTASFNLPYRIQIASLSLPQVDVNINHIGMLTGSALIQTHIWQISAEGSNLDWPQQYNPSLHRTFSFLATASGNDNTQNMSLNVFSDPQSLALKIQRTLQNGNWQTTVQALSLNDALVHIRLQKPFQIQETQGVYQWQKACLTDVPVNRICSSGDYGLNHPLHFTLNVALHDLHLLDTLAPELDQTQGTIIGSLQVELNHSTPDVAGQLELKNGDTLIPDLGIRLDNIKAILKKEGNQLKLMGSGDSGQGSFTVLGSYDLNSAQDQPLLFQVAGQDLNVLNLPAGRVDITPVVTYTLTRDTQTLAGNILIDNALINGDNIRKRATSDTDVVFVNDHGKIIQNPGHVFKANLAVTLGKNVRFQGLGIDTLLQGTLAITSQPGTPLIGNGTWTLIQGKYQAYGKSFTLERGALHFYNSPLNNPELDVVAQYNLPQTVTAFGGSALTLGVNVTGTLTRPSLNFFSNPAMSQANILSYIVLGVPLSQASQSGTSALSQAALSYALNGGDVSLLGDLKNSMGIDMVSVGNITPGVPTQLASKTTLDAGSNNTAVFIGKQVTDRLYVSYGLGVFNNQQELDTRYTIDRHWQVRTNSSTLDNGADVVYTLEREGF